MDTAVVTSSLQSFLVQTSANDSRLLAPSLSSNVRKEEDIVQSTSVLLQDLDQASELTFPTFTTQASTALKNRQGLTLRYNIQSDLSPFSQSFLSQNADSGSPALTTTDTVAMTTKDSLTSFPQHMSSSPGGHEGHGVLSDPLSHFISAAATTAEIEAVFSEALQDASGSQYFQQPDQTMEHVSRLIGQTRSPTAYQSMPSGHQMSGIGSLSMSEEGQNISTLTVNPSPVTGTGTQPSARTEQQPNKKSTVPPPPKKPLSPYMRFSKGVWQQVKAANPGMSVCEVGATIGRIWRELSDTDKQHFIDEFNTDKARYDGEFQNYLKVTGLQASDLIKPRGKKKDGKDKQSISRSNKQQDAQNTLSGTVTDHLPASQDRSSKPQGQPNEVTVGNGQQDTFVAGRPDGVKVEGTSSLPSFSQVWSNSEFITGQDLLTQMVLSGQYQQQQQQQQQVDADSQRISVDGNNHQMVTSFSNHGMTVNRQQITSVEQPPSSTNDQADPKGWSWPQVNVRLQSSQGMAQPNEGVLVYQLPANGACPSAWQNAPTNPANQNGQLALHDESPESHNQSLMTIQGQYGNATDGVGCIFQMTQNAVYAADDSKRGGIIVDQEKLQLRNALLDKSEEVLRLMKELEQAYSLIHQLKQQNDFFHQQWNLHHHSGKQNSNEADSGGSSAHST